MKTLNFFLLLLAISHPAISLQNEDNVACIVVDKPYHAAGELLAYTLYNLDAKSNLLNLHTTVAYVDLIHPYGANVLTQAIQLTNGRASGVLILPDTLSGGIYKLTAEITGRSFIREVIIDGSSKLNTPAKGRMTLSLSPEGGRLVNGISGWVGIKVTDILGLSPGTVAEGVVKQTNGVVVTRFQINEKGYGKFQLLPTDTEKYSVETTLYGQSYTQALSVAAQGFTLSTEQSDADTLRILIKSSPEWYGKRFNLRLCARGEINLQTAGVVRSLTGIRIKIPSAVIMQGVNEIQLGIEGDSLYSKRAIYIPASQRLNVEVSKTSFNTRESSAIQLKLKDQDNKPVLAYFTATVYENRYAPLYTSFEESLLARSYTRYSNTPHDSFFTDEMLNFYSGVIPQKPAVKDRQGFINVLEGQVSEPETGNPLRDKVVVISLVSPLHLHPILLFEKTDAEGKFKVVTPPINGNLTVFVKVKDIGERSSGVRFTMKHRSGNSKNNEQTIGKSNVRFDLGNASGYYKTFRENKAIAESYNTSPIQILEDGKDAFTSHAFTNFTSHYTLTEYVVPATLKEVIADILDGVVVRKNKGQDELRIVKRDVYNKRNNQLFKGQPLMLVDGIPVVDPAVLFAIPTSEILTIEMNHDSLVFKDLFLNGVFSVSTRNKQFHSRTDVNQYSYSAVSLQSPVSIKFPVYPQESQKIKQLHALENPDFRSLLYYYPLAETDKAGEALLHFSTSDDQGKFVLRIEGITDSGIPLHYTTIIEVKKP